MLRLGRHWRGIWRIIALLFLCVGVFFGYWWFYKLAPLRRTIDPGWYASHSQQEYWREVQKGIHRGQWFHDDGFTVGEYGDKSWAEWIMTHVEPGEDMSCMGRLSHSANSMRHITNQNIGYETDAWLNWWEDNKSQSQLAWIQEGFRQRGYDIDMPPATNQISTLLTILGTSQNEESESSSIPTEIKYNSFRCLRDSGFEPVTFAISAEELSAEIKQGLVVYAKMERRWPAVNRLGILPFKNNVEESGGNLPRLLKPGFQFTAYSLVFTPLLFGVVVLIYSFRKRSHPSVTCVVAASVVAVALTSVAGVALQKMSW